MCVRVCNVQENARLTSTIEQARLTQDHLAHLDGSKAKVCNTLCMLVFAGAGFNVCVSVPVYCCELCESDGVDDDNDDEKIMVMVMMVTISSGCRQNDLQ